MDVCWLDDQFLVSGSRDAKMALWRVSDDILEDNYCKKDDEDSCPTYSHISPLIVKECRTAQKVLLYYNAMYHPEITSFPMSISDTIIMLQFRI